LIGCAQAEASRGCHEGIAVPGSGACLTDTLKEALFL
jgi:hypothetical protein